MKTYDEIRKISNNENLSKGDSSIRFGGESEIFSSIERAYELSLSDIDIPRQKASRSIIPV
jgi:hypothetical protein